MKISECLCPASLDSGILTLEDGTTIDLQHVFGTLAALSDYVANATLDEDELPQCYRDAGVLTEQFS